MGPIMREGRALEPVIEAHLACLPRDTRTGRLHCLDRVEKPCMGHRPFFSAEHLGRDVQKVDASSAKPSNGLWVLEEQQQLGMDRMVTPRIQMK